MIGKTISHYKIIEKIGGGGMGIVYKAKDLKLDRFVALKFLPPELTRDEKSKERFIHEAKAASALDHPNICTVYEIGETIEEQLFIAMAYYDGETLKNKIDRGSLDIDEGIDIALQIAEGLEKAHEKNIIHRDIKPANILITNDGAVKLLDFGLAKVTTQTQLTKMGSTIGTVAYMSPEQTRGETVDQRTDIWSLGVVLYEMLTGQLPFKGNYEQAVVYSILNEKPDPVQKHYPEVSSEFLHLINLTLEKDPEKRYESTNDVLFDLKKVKRETCDDIKISSKIYPSRNINQELSKIRSKKFIVPIFILLLIAVLMIGYFLIFIDSEDLKPIPIAVIDFVNETDESELNSLSGMLITALEQSKRLSVLTRSRMFDILKQLKIKEIERIDESLGRRICNEANINTLAEATIRKFGNLYTIDFKVLNVKKNEYLFTSKEEGEGQESIPSMIDNLSENVRTGLKEKGSEIQTSKTNIAEITSPNLEAYQHYFKGEEFIDKLRFDLARREFKKAVELDSTFGLAYYRLAYAINWELQPKSSSKYIGKAIALLNRIPKKERYLVLAEQTRTDKGFEEGLNILKEMELIYPNVKEMLFNIGDWSYHIGDLNNAKDYLVKVLAIDPTFIRGLQHLTWTYRDLGQYKKMFEVAENYMTLSESQESIALMAEAYMLTGKLNSGLELLKRKQELHPDHYYLSHSIASIYSLQDKYNEAEKELSLLIIKDMPLETKQLAYRSLTGIYSYQGKYRESISAFEKVIDFYWQRRDSSLALYWQLNKGVMIAEGLHDIDSGWAEAKKTFSFQNHIDYFLYWTTLPLVYLSYGDYLLADSLAMSAGVNWWYLTVRSIILAKQHACDKAESTTNTEFKSFPGFAKILLFYNLARCQYENGQFDKAIKYLQKLQNIYDNRYSIRAMFYPKSYYLLAEIFEQKGEHSLALKYYSKFLELWKDADKDLPELIDAKKRYKKLMETN